MADTPVICPDRPGRVLKATFYKNGTAVASDLDGSESGNAPGDYTFTVTGSLTGIHQIVITSAGQAVAKREVKLYNITGQLMSVEPGTAEAREAACYPDRRIYIDTTNGVAGSVICENGTITNPVSTWADALTLNGVLGFNRYFIIRSTITLTADITNTNFDGESYTLNANSNEMSACKVLNGIVAATSTVGNLNSVKFFDTQLFGLTITSGYLGADRCSFSQTYNLANASSNSLNRCHQWSPLSDPRFDFQLPASATRLHVLDWQGNLVVRRMNSNSTLNLVGGSGRLEIGFNCTGGTINIYGGMSILDSVSGGFTGTINRVVTDVNVDQVNKSKSAAETIQAVHEDADRLTVVNAVTLPATTTVFETDGTDTANDTFKGRTGTWYNASGNPANKGSFFIASSQGVTDNPNDKVKITLDSARPLAVAPADGDVFVILGARSS